MKTIRSNFDRLFILGGVLVAVALAAVVGCTPPKAQDSPELAAVAGKWQEAYNAGDAEAIAALYTEDCRLMPPGAELMEGRDAAAASFTEMIASGAKLELQSVQAVAGGDLGYHVGRYVMRTPDGAVAERGKYIETWRKTAAGWKIANDIWNTDAPVPPPGATVIFTHDVKDGAHWLAAWQGENSRAKQFAEHGVAGARTFQDRENPNRTALLVQVTEPEALQTFLTSPEGDKAKAEDGLIDRTLRVYAEVK